jgi:hypothetical protein
VEKLEQKEMINQSDTAADTLTKFTGIAAIASIATAWQPILSSAVSIIGLISGVMAIIYYRKKLKE